MFLDDKSLLRFAKWYGYLVFIVLISLALFVDPPKTGDVALFGGAGLFHLVVAIVADHLLKGVEK